MRTEQEKKLEFIVEMIIDDYPEPQFLIVDKMKDIAIGFAEWVDDMGFRQHSNGVWVSKGTTHSFSTEQLFNEYLNTLK